MIDEKQYEELLENGLCMDHFLVLCNLKSGIPLLKNRRVNGFVNLLIKRGYIGEDQELTEKGLELAQTYEVITAEPTTKEVEFNEWVEEVRVAMVDKLEEITGKKQILARMTPKSKGYYFMPNFKDLAKNLQKVMTLYKIKDRELIKNKLVSYVENCANSGEFFPLVKYYIMKDGASQFVDSLEDEEEATPAYKSSQKFL